MCVIENERREEKKKENLEIGRCPKASPAFLGLIFTLWRDAPVDVMIYTIP